MEQHPEFIPPNQPQPLVTPGEDQTQQWAQFREAMAKGLPDNTPKYEVVSRLMSRLFHRNTNNPTE